MANKREATSESERVCVGAIAGAFGVRGEARIKPFTSDPEAIGDYGPLETEDGARTFEIRVTRMVKGGLAARLSGVETREQVEALRGVRLYVPRERLPDLEEDEFYHADLIGMVVVDLADNELGVVRSVQNYGAGDFLEVHSAALKHPALLPFTRDAVPHIDLGARRVVSDPPEGVFPDPQDSLDPKDPKDPAADADAGKA
ncbi:MAG: ribosome maturation factor RimM [Neomegalonema sp.]|nr:ribosome maturation factor RimM [Neomegalonema sp.]